MQTNIWTYYKHVVAFVPKSWEKERGRQMLNIFRTTYLCSEGKMLLQIRLMLLCNKKFNVQIQPYLSKIKHVFLFLCSVVTGLPTTTKAPPPSQKWVRGKHVGGGLIYLVSGSSHSMTIQPQKRLWPFIQGAVKEIDEEGVMEVEACEDFLHIMFNPLRQILLVLYKCQIHNLFSPCAVQRSI